MKTTLDKLIEANHIKKLDKTIIELMIEEDNYGLLDITEDTQNIIIKN